MQYKFIVYYLLYLFWPQNLTAQNILKGEFAKHNGQLIRLMGYKGLEQIIIDSTIATSAGQFELKYNDNEYGVAYLTANDYKPYVVILAKEDILLKGDSFNAPESIVIESSKENVAFVTYAVEHAKREQSLSAWKFLQNIYYHDELFSNQQNVNNTIESEVMRIQKQDTDFLNNLPDSSYVKWYLPIRTLISLVSTVAQYRTEEIPATISAFRKINYSDFRLNNSGLLSDLIESHYWLLENMGKPLDSVFIEMNTSTDSLLYSLSKNEQLYNEVIGYLFKYFEKHSLFQASEYLALKALAQNSFQLQENLANQLESYRKLKKGAIAPDINFIGDLFQNGESIKSVNTLSAIKTKYKLIVFGASWCPSCQEALPQFNLLYQKWKSIGVEVIYISLDTDKNAVLFLSKNIPFIVFSDYQKWNMRVVKDYQVYGTPTIFLLNSENKILLRPVSVKQVDLWLDYNTILN
jgi:thiol-disulfide isomerase/thioredoxin